MRIVIQRVKKVNLVADGQEYSSIKNGLLVLLGIKKGDSKLDVNYLVKKLINLRIMADENQKMNLNIFEANAEMMIVSQFTLNANIKDGNRPSFIDAEEPEKAKYLYENFIKELVCKNAKIKTGKFGSYMDINAELDGPVTIIIDSNDK